MAIITGTRGDDTLTGTTFPDEIRGGDGDDSLDGRDGADLLDGGEGSDRLDGGPGDDLLLGGPGADTAVFDVVSGGSDRTDLGDGSDQVEVTTQGRIGFQIRLTFSVEEVGNGNVSDRTSIGLQEGGLAVRLQGEDLTSDVLVGPVSRFDDEGVLFRSTSPGVAFDVRDLSGAAQGDRFRVVQLGTAAGEALNGQAGEVNAAVISFEPLYINGGGGNDRISGGAAADVLVGGDGDDLIGGRVGSDAILGGAGHDFIGGEEGNDTISGGDGVDVLFGDAGADLIGGGAGADRLFGGEGDDFMGGEADDDFLDGGAGVDVLFGDGGGDILIGGLGNDRVFGQDGNDGLRGDDGDDYLDGGAGNDTLEGGAGADRLRGGGGADRFIFNLLSDGRDFIEDFAPGDLVDFSRIDADPFRAGDQAFVIVNAFTNQPGQMIVGVYDVTNLKTAVFLDQDGDGRPDLALDLQGDARVAVNFVL